MDNANQTVEKPIENEQLSTILQAALIFLVCFIGAACNLLSFVVILRHPTFQNSFGYLTAYHAVSNAAVLSIFILWAVPWTIWMIPSQLYVINRRVGQLSLFFVETAFHCSLLISLNRFVAITFPLRYHYIFTKKVTAYIITFISAISFAYWGIYFKDGCDFYYDHDSRVWAFGDDTCSVWLGFYIDMCYNVVIFIAVGILDMVTIVTLRKTKNAMRRHKVKASRSKNSTTKERKELMFFVQAVLNSSIYAFMLICFHLIAPAVTTDFGLFLCTTFIWGFSHAAGGVILVAFNPEIRRHLPCCTYRTTKPIETCLSVTVRTQRR